MTYSVDLELGEAGLQHFVVVHILVVLLGGPVELAHGHLARVHDIQKLHRDGSIARLFDLCPAINNS